MNASMLLENKYVSITSFNVNITRLKHLFFFELKDEIFLTSSTDTDYYKLIKYNNVIAYLLFILIIELNPGQLLNLKDDKRCNYFFFEKFGKPLFENIYFLMILLPPISSSVSATLGPSIRLSTNIELICNVGNCLYM